MINLKPTDEPKRFTVHTYDLSKDRFRFQDLTRQDMIDASVKQAFYTTYRDVLTARAGRKIEDVPWADWWISHRGRVYEQFTPVLVA